MPVSAGAVLVKQAAETKTATQAASAALVKRAEMHLLTATVHAASEGSPFLRTFSASSATVASLVKAVTHAFAVANPPAATLRKQAAHPLLATQAETATVTTPASTNIKTLSAASAAVGTNTHGKLLTLKAGYNVAIPPMFIGVAPSGTLARVFKPGQVLTATSPPVGTKKLQLNFTKSATNASSGSLTAVKVRSIVSVAASAAANAVSLARAVALGLLGAQPQTATAYVQRPYRVTATQGSTAFLTAVERRGIASLTLHPAVSGSLSLNPAQSGSLSLTPII